MVLLTVSKRSHVAVPAPEQETSITSLVNDGGTRITKSWTVPSQFSALAAELLRYIPGLAAPQPLVATEFPVAFAPPQNPGPMVKRPESFIVMQLPLFAVRYSVKFEALKLYMSSKTKNPRL